MRIYKYHPDQVPLNSRIVKFAPSARGELFVWALLGEIYNNPENEGKFYDCAVVYTGDEFPDDYDYFDTAILDNGLVYHLVIKYDYSTGLDDEIVLDTNVKKPLTLVKT